MIKQDNNSDILKKTFVVMYHGTSRLGGHGTMQADAFEKQLKFLSRFFSFTSIQDILSNRHFNERKILLTFDDGYQNNYNYAIPVLKRLNIPAVFFVSTRHCLKHKFLWFSYLKAFNNYFPETGIRIRGNFFDLRANHKKESLSSIRNLLLDLRPHPEELYKIIDQELPKLESFVPEEIMFEYFAGISEQELNLIANEKLFTIGAHTADHAFLHLCSDVEARYQILSNINILERATGNKILTIAYPSGAYNEKILEICKDFRILLGFSVYPIRKSWDSQDIPRIGIYSPSLVKMLVKILSVSKLRTIDVKTG